MISFICQSTPDRTPPPCTPPLGLGGGAEPPANVGWLATTHHSFLGSFSAVSKRNFASKDAFCRIFQNLQNYLADFLKKLQDFEKNRKILQNFARICEISGFCKERVQIFAKIADFLLQNFASFKII